MFADITRTLPRAGDAWEQVEDMHRDPSEWDVEGQRRNNVSIDFRTLRARFFPDGLVGY